MAKAVNDAAWASNTDIHVMCEFMMSSFRGDARSDQAVHDGWVSRKWAERSAAGAPLRVQDIVLRVGRRLGDDD